jgi:hypothetical protein
MSCRCGAGCARRRDWRAWARACWRGRRSESPRRQAYGEARPPDEASRTGAGMRCRMGSRTSHTAGRRSAPRTNSSRCWRTSIPTRADRLGGCGGWLRAQSQGGASRPRLSACAEDARPRDEDPSGTRRTSQALSAANARERTRVWPAHPGSWRQAVLAAGPVAGEWRVLCSAHTVLNLVGGRG